jgi:hypothetical protein
LRRAEIAALQVADLAEATGELLSPSGDRRPIRKAQDNGPRRMYG